MNAVDKVNEKWAAKMDEESGEFIGTDEEYMAYFCEAFDAAILG